MLGDQLSLVNGATFTKRGTSDGTLLKMIRTCVYNLRPEFPLNEMETTEANLEIKVTQLDMTVDKTNAVLQGGQSEAIERHLSTLKHIFFEINHSG